MGWWSTCRCSRVDVKCLISIFERLHACREEAWAVTGSAEFCLIPFVCLSDLVHALMKSWILGFGWRQRQMLRRLVNGVGQKLKWIVDI